jgi:hypothetical protein
LLVTAALAASLLLAPGLTGGFVFDDYPGLVHNTNLQMSTLNWEQLVRAARGYGGPFGRPLSTMSLALDHALHGMNPFWFKLTNLGIHALNTLLLGVLIYQLLPLAWTGAAQPRLNRAAALIAFCWGAHPLQVSAALYVIQRMELLAHTFVLLSLIAYVRARTSSKTSRATAWMVLSGASFLLGLMSKENAIQTPMFAASIEIALLRFQCHSTANRKRLIALYVCGALAAVAGYLVWAPWKALNFAMRDFTAWERVLTQFRVLPVYLEWMVWPSPANLSFYHDDLAPSRGWLEPWTTLAGFVLLLMMAVVAVRARKRYPMTTLGILVFFSSHIVTSSAINLELMFEHRNYLAVLALILPAADLIRLASTRGHSASAAIIATAVIVVFGFTTTLRAMTWGNEALFANSATIDNPASPRASYELATQYIQRAGDDSSSLNYTLAMAEFERASQLPRSSPLPEQALILIATKLHQPVQVRWWERLSSKFSTRPLGPQELSAFYALHSERIQGRPLDDARLQKISEIYVERAPRSFEAHLLYADFAGRILKSPSLAARQYCYAAQLKRDKSMYLEKLVAGLIEQNRMDEAAAMANCRG